MVHWFWYLLGAYGVAELYKKYATPEEKNNWEDKIKLHHGEIGTLLTLVGVLTKSHRLASTGLGLALHDKDDVSKWFTGDKNICL